MEVQSSDRDQNTKRRGPAAADNHAVFDDPTINQTLVEDPLFVFVRRWWRQIVLVVGAVVLGYFGQQSFKDTYQKSMRHSAEMFTTLHAQVAELGQLRSDLEIAQHERDSKAADPKATAADKETAEKKLTESKDKIAALEAKSQDLLRALNDAREPYKSLAAAFSAVLSAQHGDFGLASSKLGTLGWQAVALDSRERFFSELTAFGLAGALLDNDQELPRAQAELKALAEKGEFMAFAAARRLARSAATVEERSQAAMLLQAIQKRQPEQNDLATAELNRLTQ
ncbi:MAG: hypothetical protein K1X83_12035 [Oligoflexia bacterium]|nr:hypothetical protein [Oligoflexia bacterium]